MKEIILTKSTRKKIDPKWTTKFKIKANTMYHIFLIRK